MWNGQTVSVVFTTYRDLATIREVIEGLFATGVVDEVVAVDNNAEEGTKEEILQTPAKYVHEPRQGVGYGFLRAIREATGDIIITIEVDGTYSPRDVHKFLAYADDFDVVCGTRTAAVMIAPGSDMDFFTRWPNLLYAKLIEVLFNTPNLTDVGCVYRLIKRSAWERIQHCEMDGGWAFNLDWTIHIARARIKFVEIAVNFLPREGDSVGAAASRIQAAKIAVRMMGFLIRHRLNLIKHPKVPASPSS